MESRNKTYKKAIFLDHDGPINDISKSHYDPEIHQQMQEFSQHEAKELFNHISNSKYLSPVLNFLADNEVLIVPGSQRTTFSSQYLNALQTLQKQVQQATVVSAQNIAQLKVIMEKLETNPSHDLSIKEGMLAELARHIDNQLLEKKIYEGTLAAYDENFGKDRNFLLTEHIQILKENFAGFSKENSSKVPLIKNINNIPGAEHLEPSDIYHVDDDLEHYRKSTQAAGYHFIYTERMDTHPGYFSFNDNQYLAHMLNIIALPKDNVNWTEGIHAINATQRELEKFADKSVAQELAALMKVDFALQQVYKAVTNPNIYEVELQDKIELITRNLSKELINNDNIQQSQPLLFLDYIKGLTNPDTPKSSLKLPFLEKYIKLGVENAEACNMNGTVIKNQLNDIRQNVANTVVNTISDLLQQSKNNKSLVLNYANEYLINSKDIALIAEVGCKMLDEREGMFKNLFENKSHNPMSFFKSYADEGSNLISAFKKRIIALANNETNPLILQNLMSETSKENQLLHFHVGKFNKNATKLTDSEEKVIQILHNKGISLPADARQEAFDYSQQLSFRKTL